MARINPFQDANQKKEVAELEKMHELPDMEERFKYAAKILAEHGGLESNIAINHPYWKLRP